MKVSAPGKMMISGEYAVLEGAPAIVAAVQTRALAWVAEGEHPDRASESRFPEAFASAAIAAEALGTEAPPFRIDVSELRRAGQKLGVGSSSAAAAAAAALVYALADTALDDPGVLRAALDGHREVAPSGSGADVAACTLGGFVRYQRKAGTWNVSATPVKWPEGLVARVAWTGSAASTHQLVGLVHQLRDSRPSDYRRAMDRLARESERFVDSFESGNVIEATHAYFEAMRALGDAAGAPIVEERLTKVSEIARSLGGAAKPSGAGGGDVALAVFSDPEAIHRFDAIASDEGIEILDIRLGGPGVRVEPS